MTTKISTALAALTTASLLALGAPAFASHGGDDGPGDDNGGSQSPASGSKDDRIIKTGSCSDGARWKLKVKTDDGGLEVEGEVDTNRAGQTWRWKFKDNGAVVAKGSSTTGGRSGSFSAERRIADRPGTDNVVFKAKFDGQVCTGTVAF
jgi:hypothetical protein